MKKIIIVVVTVFLSAGCAAGGPADLTPALRVQDGGLQYQDESGNWKAVANQDAVKDALEQSAGKEADPSEAGKAPEIEESLSSPAAIQGAKGEKGDKGNKGDKGDKGDSGPAGPAGKDGSNGTVVTIGLDGELIMNGRPTGYLLTKKTGTNYLLDTPKITKVEQYEHSTGVLATWARIKNAGSYTVSCEDMQYTTTEINAFFDDLSVGDHVIYITANPISGRNDYSTSLTGEYSFSVNQSSLDTPYASWSYADQNYENMTAVLNLSIYPEYSAGKVQYYEIYIDGELYVKTSDRVLQISSFDVGEDHIIRVVAVPADKSKYVSSETTFYTYRAYYPTPTPTPTPSTPEPTPVSTLTPSTPEPTPVPASTPEAAATTETTTVFRHLNLGLVS